MSRFEFEKTHIDGLYVISPKPIKDDRGYFERFFCKEDFSDIGLDKEIVQINHSFSKGKGTIRGLHYQLSPCAETKIVRCLRGNIYDIAVDIRKDSPTFLQWFGIELSEDNGQYLYIPEGFAHGFQSLSEECEIIYLVTNNYSSDKERGLSVFDEKINIKWPIECTNISSKDENTLQINNDFKGIEI
jgi:dTDP-4-dehydrorhamnose 3,5-epimerase